jgi:hypothetical protein
MKNLIKNKKFTNNIKYIIINNLLKSIYIEIL